MAVTKTKADLRDELLKTLNSAVESMRFGGERLLGAAKDDLLLIQSGDGSLGIECPLLTESRKFRVTVFTGKIWVMEKGADKKSVVLVADYVFDANNEPRVETATDRPRAESLLNDVRDLRAALVHSGVLSPTD